MDIDRNRRTNSKKTDWSGSKPDKFARSQTKASKHRATTEDDDERDGYRYDVRESLDLT